MIGIVVKCFGKKCVCFLFDFFCEELLLLVVTISIKKYDYNRFHIVFLVENYITARINIIWYFDTKILSSRLYGR